MYTGYNADSLPAYLISEAAHHLRIPKATVRSWALGRKYPTKTGKTDFTPVITIADPHNRLLSFRNLVELHILSSIRRTRKVRMQAIRNAVDYLQDKFRSDHPLLQHDMLTNGKDIFIEQYGQLVDISNEGQMVMKQILAVYLDRIEWGDSVFPVRFFPFTRPAYEQSPRIISIDPRISFGKPCLSGTRIPTAIVAERYAAGDSIALLADDYERPPEEIEEAIRFEGTIAA